ncbi:hypothetical protein CERZMDRAFT_90539 [Cercospora zeae-maydis SCOH1-5]|uniref:Uncharacterized protein n=1 Tax=Cercospora zeae-maydis SCOH1-5 TaxID=717836 RepID=A0A6A6FIE6_9PEZI|nr:hypothetical protein CERZMDRAFT_90539 [Cercospora zeae-maydis SCOH1-5]
MGLIRGRYAAVFDSFLSSRAIRLEEILCASRYSFATSHRLFAIATDLGFRVDIIPTYLRNAIAGARWLFEKPSETLKAK